MKSSMFELNDVQTKILKACFDLQIKNPNDEYCVTSYSIRNQKIPGRTFDINKDELLYYQLIRITHEVKTGKQTRIYYELTPIGFFSLIKSLAKNNPSILENYIKYIPHLGEKWDKYIQILKPYQFLLPRLLNRALNEINILPQYRLHTRDYKFRPRIDELIRIIFEDRGYEIRLSELYYPFKEGRRGIHHKTFLKTKEKIWKKIFSKESIQISAHMVNRLIFLFYFNAMKLKYDDRYGYHLFNDAHVDDFLQMKLEIPKEHEITDFESLKQKHEKKWNEYDKFWKTKRVKFFDHVMNDIIKNDDLFFIFLEGFQSLLILFSYRPVVVEEIDKNIFPVLIKKGLASGLIKVKKAKDPDSESKN
jgi:hypothetical protein